jgi:flagellar hook-length control protein FliK
VKTQVPTIVESLVGVPAPKPGGAWTPQQSTLAGLGRQDQKELGSGVASVALDSRVIVLNSQEAGVRIPERPAKLLPSRFNSGSEDVYGLPLAQATAADVPFQGSPTMAAASTTLADTVSQWASQGVQSASLQLDGLGDHPVEVRISVNGDMAQVDFKTNQPEVRQVIEGAASQLKELLSSQGLQLAGMSIGTSARGGEPYKEKDPKPATDARKVTQVKSDIVETGRVRMANPSVGQSLDLFV